MVLENLRMLQKMKQQVIQRMMTSWTTNLIVLMIKKDIQLSIIHQQDVRTQAIRFANDFIQQCDAAITSSSDNDSVLEQSKSLHGSLDHLIFLTRLGKD